MSETIKKPIESEPVKIRNYDHDKLRKNQPMRMERLKNLDVDRFIVTNNIKNVFYSVNKCDFDTVIPNISDCYFSWYDTVEEHNNEMERLKTVLIGFAHIDIYKKEYKPVPPMFKLADPKPRTSRTKATQPILDDVVPILDDVVPILDDVVPILDDVVPILDEQNENAYDLDMYDFIDGISFDDDVVPILDEQNENAYDFSGDINDDFIDGISFDDDVYDDV